MTELFAIVFLIGTIFGLKLSKRLTRDVDVMDVANKVADITNTRVGTVHKILKPALPLMGLRGRLK